MGSTDNFPVYLPSNTRNSLYENKTSNYRVQLAKPLEFPDGNWEVGLAEITYPYTWYDVPVPATIHVLTTLPIPNQKLLLSGTNITPYDDAAFKKPPGAHALVPFAYWATFKSQKNMEVETWYFAVSSNIVLPPQYESHYATDANKLATFINSRGAHYFSPTAPSILIHAGQLQKADDMIFSFTVSPFKRTNYSLNDTSSVKIVTVPIPIGIYRTPERLLQYIVNSFNVIFAQTVDATRDTLRDMSEYIGARARVPTSNQMNNPRFYPPGHVEERETPGRPLIGPGLPEALIPISPADAQEIVNRNTIPNVPSNYRSMSSTFTQENGEMRLNVASFDGACSIYMSDPWLLGALGITNYRHNKQDFYVIDIERELITFPAARIGAANILVYCSIIQHQMMGNTLVPLLRPITIPSNKNRGETINEKFLRPYYVPVWKSHIPDIEISLCDDQGRNITFQAGSTMVVLHFRRIRHGYN
jgi:hypothetical protein